MFPEPNNLSSGHLTKQVIMWNVALHAAYWGFALSAINSKRRCVVRGFRAQARQPGPYPGGGAPVKPVEVGLPVTHFSQISGCSTRFQREQMFRMLPCEPSGTKVYLVFSCSQVIAIHRRMVSGCILGCQRTSLDKP